ncbi:hypothetical protein E2C06_04240 [Dankookia rubra]|uniref:Uncharacterized protein n=1 Tax=Dankookia rubra TaxID=1442381 RepID=A0A4V3AAM7_9PROT|nr:hypothetical protein [Dankookia rubra]TDH64035.1 hypothetical protein E2C06_04240 [Dankookia rubra]
MSRKSRQPPPRRPPEGKAGSGTPADRLLRAWLDQDDEAFAEQAEELIARGRDGVLQATLRKLAERYEDDAVEDFALALTEIAEVAEAGPGFDMAELVLLPVLATGALPDPAPLASGLAASGAFPAEAEIAFLAGWRSAEAVGGLSPVALRRVLQDVAAGRPPADLPPLEDAVPEEGSIALLVGAAIFRAAPPAEDPDADLDALDALAEAKADASLEAFAEWREALTPGQTGGALVLGLCAPSELADEIRSLIEEPGEAAVEEILDFVDAARAEAGGEAVAVRLASREAGVAITVLTEAGRVLDSRVFGEDEEDALDIEAVREALEGQVAIIEA